MKGIISKKLAVSLRSALTFFAVLFMVVFTTLSAQLPTVPAGYTVRVHATGGLLAGKQLLGVVADPVSGNVYVAASAVGAGTFSISNFSLYMITPSGVVSLVGTYPFSHYEMVKMAWGPSDGKIYTLDLATSTARAIDPATGVATLFASGTGAGRYGLEFDPSGNLILGFEAMFTFYKLTPAGRVSLGTVSASVPNGNHGDAFGIQPNGNYIVYVDCGGQNNYSINTAGHVDGTPYPTLAWTSPTNVFTPSLLSNSCGYSVGTIDPETGDVYSTIANFGFGNSRIVYTPAAGGPTTLFLSGAGDGLQQGITDLTFGKSTIGCSKSLFIVDRYQNKVFEVTKECVQPPVLSCPANIIVDNDPGVCGATVNYPAATATGTPEAVITYSHPTGSLFPIGTTTVTVTAENGASTNATCTFTITVNAANTAGGSWYRDQDNDGFGDPAQAVQNCTQPEGYVANNTDNCPDISNANQADSDGDGIGDLCDTCPLDAGNDSDGDGLCANVDNCPTVANADQVDNDNDGIGDVCDTDDDNDGVPDETDNCALIANGNQMDTDNDGLGNVCDADDDNDGTSDGADCAPLNAAVHPGATEICNGVDDDCDGTTDEGFINTVVTCSNTGTINRNVSACTYTIEGTEFDAIVVENCSPLSYTLTGATSGSGTSLAGVELNAGETVVTWSATNSAGVTATCSFTVIVIPPVPNLVCPEDVVVTAALGQCSAVVNYTAPIAPPVCNLQQVSNSVSFNYTGNYESFTVPAGVTSITIKAWGAQGGGSSSCTGGVSFQEDGGLGGYSEGVLSVSPGQILNVYVGGKPETPPNVGNTNTSFPGGFNGGGTAGFWGGGGGGASDVRAGGNGLNHRVIVAAGGGGGNTGCPDHGTGGNGGGLIGGNGINLQAGIAATGATQSAGGNGGNYYGYAGLPGSFGDGGDAPAGQAYHYAGGGGGYYGGGSSFAGGGSGGSSYVGGVQNGSASPGVNTGHGKVEISWSGNLQYTVTQTAGLPSGAEFPVGITTNTFAITDNYGNTTNCNFTVTVNDDQIPTVATQDQTIQLDANGTAEIMANQVNNGSSDNCGIANITVSPAIFDCSNVGANTVTLTVTDVNGNTQSGTAVVTVQDAILPTVVTKNIIVQLDANGEVSITGTQLDNGSTDNCEIQTFVATPNNFNCSNVGVNTVTLTVTDVNGNSNTGTATVTVEDKVKPTVLTKDITVQLDASGTATITAAQVDNGSSDNCSVQTVSVSPSVFSCSNVGANIVTLTVTDVNGNSNTGTATVTVEDKVKPTVLTQDITVQLDGSGAAMITAAQVDNGSTDNCGVQTVSVSPSVFGCSNVGANTVTLTVTDINGNSQVGTATVTIEDNIVPTVLTRPITVQLNTSGIATITAAQIDNGSFDNCGIQTLSVSPAIFDCSSIGANEVVLTVVDVNGNSNTAPAIVTVTALQATTTVQVTTPRQYSDEVTFVATVSPGKVAGDCYAATTVTFKIGERIMGSVVLSWNEATNRMEGSLTTTLFEIDNTLSVVPGTKLVTAVFTGINQAFIVGDATTSLLITHENARAEYTGSQFVSTPNISISNPVTATVPLRMNVQDVSQPVIPDDGWADNKPGDIRRAKGRFIIRETGLPVVVPGTTDGNGWVAVSLLNPTDSLTGTVAVDWSVTLSSNQYSYSPTIDIEIGGPNGYYLRSDPDDKTVVTISRPSMDFVTGGGVVMPGNAGGQFAPATGRKINFGFNLKYNKSGKNLQGNVNIVYRKVINGETRLLQIKGNSMIAMGVNTSNPLSKRANFTCKATLNDVTNPLAIIGYGGNHTLELKMTDNGEPGNMDSIAVTLYKSDGTLLMSSHWVNIATREKKIVSGNIQISGSSVAQASVRPLDVVVEESKQEMSLFTIKVSPNPAASYFRIVVESPVSDLAIQLRIMDINGVVKEIRNGIIPGQPFEIGHLYRPGTYVAEAIQGQERRSITIIKLSN